MAVSKEAAPLARPLEAIIGPVRVVRQTRDEAIGDLLYCLQTRTMISVAFANAHALLMAMEDPSYAQTLDRFRVLNDGLGAHIAALALEGHGFPENLNGTDFVPALLKAASPGLRIYLLGAKPAVVQAAAAALTETYPQHVIAGYHHGYFDPEATGSIVAGINEARADLLLVAMGNPRQESTINQIRDEVEVPVAIGVGALLDFIAGAVPRAPKLMRACGLEWLFRLLLEPRRLGPRYTVGIVRFLWRVLMLRREMLARIGFVESADSANGSCTANSMLTDRALRAPAIQQGECFSDCADKRGISG